jgi:hypothetical protein
MRESDVSREDLIAHLAQGEAAWMLLESLMLAMIDRGLVSRDDLIDMVENVSATKKQMVAEREHPRIASVAVGLLSTLGNSLAAHKKK